MGSPRGPDQLVLSHHRGSSHSGVFSWSRLPGHRTSTYHQPMQENVQVVHNLGASPQGYSPAVVCCPMRLSLTASLPRPWWTTAPHAAFCIRHRGAALLCLAPGLLCAPTRTSRRASRECVSLVACLTARLPWYDQACGKVLRSSDVGSLCTRTAPLWSHIPVFCRSHRRRNTVGQWSNVR